MEGVTRLQTSTPNNDDTNSTSDRRTVRSRPVSYAEFPDFDTSGLFLNEFTTKVLGKDIRVYTTHYKTYKIRNLMCHVSFLAGFCQEVFTIQYTSV